MFARCTSRYSKSLTTILQKSVKFSNGTTRVASLLEPSTLMSVSNGQPVINFNASTTPLIPCCQSALISLRRFSTEDGLEPGNDTQSGEELDEVLVNLNMSEQYVEEERRRNMDEQKALMNCIKITGLGEIADEDDLREEVMILFRSIGVGKADRTVIEDLFYTRKGSLGCRLSERDWVNIILASKKKNRKNIDGSVQINQWLCQGFATIDYNLRTLKREGKIRKNRIYNYGRPQAQLLDSEEWVEITHMQDLVELGLIHEV